MSGSTAVSDFDDEYSPDARNRVVVRWAGEDGRPTDPFGKLSADARVDGFAGISGAWFNREDVLAFADALRTPCQKPAWHCPVDLAWSGIIRRLSACVCAPSARGGRSASE